MSKAKKIALFLYRVSTWGLLVHIAFPELNSAFVGWLIIIISFVSVEDWGDL